MRRVGTARSAVLLGAVPLAGARALTCGTMCMRCSLVRAAPLWDKHFKAGDDCDDLLTPPMGARGRCLMGNGQ